jgi:predicted RNA-binding protein
MCLAAAYIGAESDQPVLQEISRLRIDGDTIEMETLFGEGKVLQGKLAEIDFMSSKVIIEE